MTKQYKKNGFLVIRKFFKENELHGLREVLINFHQSWKQKNAKCYADKAVNSAYITGSKYLSEPNREHLFKFIGSFKLMDVVASIMDREPTFMNTQLFFNPVNKKQKNYWHRDMQYHLSIKDQKKVLVDTNVIHFRIPLANEPGIELVPSTHKRWDTDEELDVRLENNGKRNYNNLSGGIEIELQVGDLLIFSANMIHRGLYGIDRLSLDILFCDPEPSLVEFVRDDCLPSKKTISNLEKADAFKSSIEIKAKSKAT